jgi:hypothetical protein
MSTRAKQYRAKHTATRLRAVWRRLAALRRQARRAVTLGLATAFLSMAPAATSLAQTGQTAMAPSGGMLGRAVNGLRDLNQNGPGIFYYGVNAADRGLGYRGSYMTAGGFIPVVEDDLGGYWSADMRGHLSEYGGFFSNVGAVRKQFIGGTLLGVGVFWDYDGDMNQYDDTIITDASGSYVFDGGQAYNQVGISGEWLTDFGNLKSNGYIPVGPTGDIVGPFLGNSILCVNGVNAALGGADLEVGAYIPGLSDWAGMINVGGYAYGNTRYEFPGGQGAVPWFGGVYTRLDMTFVENWDFSLQANNDSYFDWTGFARLTYRMGGSRRRNVPDQVEQPMMRNEHIVRAHQAPVVALNPNNLDGAGNPLPWQMFHVDNSAAPGGNGTANSPFQTLAEAEAAAVATWDIVYVYVGNSLTTPYSTPIGGYSFAAENQSLLGEGTSITIPTVACGDRSLAASNNPNLYPIITNPVGAAINVDQPGTRVDHLEIANSSVGISDGAGFSAPGVATITDVIIRGTNAPFERGVEIANSDGRFVFDNVRLSNLGNDGFVISAIDGDVAISNSSLTNIDGRGIAVPGAAANVSVTGTTISNVNGTGIDAIGDDSVVTVSNTTITNMTGIIGDAVVASGDRSRVTIDATAISTTTGQGIVASGTDSVVIATASTITDTGNPAVLVEGTGATVVLDDVDISGVNGAGISATGPDAVVQMINGSTLTDTTANGIEILDPDAELFVIDSFIRDIGADGIFTDGGTVLVQNTSIQDIVGAGIRAVGVSADPDSVVAVKGVGITNTIGGGILALNSNLRVERLDVNDPTSRQTVINNTGLYGIRVQADSIGPPNEYQVLVDAADIRRVAFGISVEAGPDVLNPPVGLVPPGIVPIINFTALNNDIVAEDGPGIVVAAVFDQSIGWPGRPLARVNALMTGNQVLGGDGTDILLTTNVTTLWPSPPNPTNITPGIYRPITVAATDTVNLENLNNNAIVEILQEPASVNFDATLIVPLPPPPPPIPPIP